MNDQQVSVSRTIAQPPDRIFDLLSSPEGHTRMDGSGTVLAGKDGNPTRLELGSKFTMKMKQGPVPYKVSSHVKEFEENRLIAWSHFGGHRWRYELEPVEGGTRVTETFDWSTSKAPKLIELAGYPKKHPAGMERTLERIEQLLAEDSAGSQPT